MDSVAHSSIISRIERLERETSPKLSWFIALPVALVINVSLIPYAQKNDVPYASGVLNFLLEQENILAIDLGIYVADKISGEDRKLPQQIDRYTLLGLNQAQTTALMNNIIQSESGGSYTVINQYYYTGRWQFGASALAAIGMMSKSKLAKQPKCVSNGRCQKAFMQDTSNWRSGLSHTQFKYSKKLQDAAFVKLTNMNIEGGFGSRVLSRESKPETIAGFAKAAHLKGLRAAINWYKYGIDSHDGNKTKVSAYAKSAELAVKYIK